ncbi:hypothetical protein K439DRAFT_1632946 [Ramaria rubella]|nr:hypothetical protein K439DRAFT_1632946 [Ramaria rubella]
MGLLKATKKAVPDVQIMVMIRPRTGDFVYSDLELETMVEDIKLFKQEKVAGVVLGVLRADGTVDTKTTQRLVDVAKPLQVCFHRAFDMTRDPMEALTHIASIGGITRILTSGHGRTVPESLQTLSSIASKALILQPPITILPGSGINVNTARSVANCEWWKEFREIHLSAGNWVDGPMQFRKEDMGMGLVGSEDALQVERSI